MIVTHLELRNFRSYPTLSLDFSPKENVIFGKNGSGKTNVVEAINLFSLCKSWRCNDTRALIAYGKDASFLKASILEGELTRKVEILLTTKGKKITINGKPIKRLSELSKLLNVTLFSPEDVNLFKDSPSVRRNFLDVSISKENPEYLSLIGKHSRLLQERNAALKVQNVDRRYLDLLTERLIEISEPIIRLRKNYVERLNNVLTHVANNLYDNNRQVEIVYKPFINDANFKETAKKAYEKCLESDLLHKMTTIGVHREDFIFLLDEKNIALYGSQGENRLAAIILKVSPYFLIEDEEKKPITILDDVYSELDDKHSQRLSKLLTNLGQVFVTSADDSINGDALIDVSNNMATRRK